jgi:hypothetical protein
MQPEVPFPTRSNDDSEAGRTAMENCLQTLEFSPLKYVVTFSEFDIHNPIIQPHIITAWAGAAQTI